MENTIKKNIRFHDLTIAEIKSCKGFEHFSDEQASEVIGVFKRLAEIIFEAHLREQIKVNREQNNSSNDF